MQNERRAFDAVTDRRGAVTVLPRPLRNRCSSGMQSVTADSGIIRSPVVRHYSSTVGRPACSGGKFGGWVGGWVACWVVRTPSRETCGIWFDEFSDVSPVGRKRCAYITTGRRLQMLQLLAAASAAVPVHDELFRRSRHTYLPFNNIMIAAEYYGTHGCIIISVFIDWFNTSLWRPI